MSSSPKVVTKTPRKKNTKCIYRKYNCSCTALPSFEYCEKHIREDKTVSFKQCSYSYSASGEKCPYAVITSSSQPQATLCKEHTEEYEVSRLKPKGKLLPPLTTADTILYGLSHYIRNSPYYKKEENLVGATADELLEQIEKNKNVVVNPFTDIEASEINAKTNETLNFSCEIDSDIEASTIDNVWDNDEQDSSDPESLDLEMNDPLRHAGVFTEEEMILAVRNRAVRLHNLCIQQYRRLLYLLREKKSKYLTEVKREKEIYGPVLKSRQMALHEKKQYDLLKALSKYQKIGTGPEVLLFKKMLDRRKAVTPGLFVRTRNYNKCVYSEGGVKCSLRVIPSTKYCKKHILNDRYQVLFQECGVQKKDHICKEPVVPIPNITCISHLTLPINLDTKIPEIEKNKKPSLNDEKLPDTEKEEKLELRKELDPIEMLLTGYSQKQEPNDSSVDVSSSSFSQTKNITDEIDLNMTDKLFEDIPENLQRTITSALDNISQSMEGHSEMKLESSGVNDEDLELKSVVKEISNYFEMNDSNLKENI